MSSLAERTRRRALALFQKKDGEKKNDAREAEKIDTETNENNGKEPKEENGDEPNQDTSKKKLTATKAGAKATTEPATSRTGGISDLNNEGEPSERDSLKRSAALVGRLRTNTLGLFQRSTAAQEPVLSPREVEGTAEKTGWMRIEVGGTWKSWKERWFVLKEAKLFYSTTDTSKELSAKIDLFDATLSLEERYTNNEFEMRTCVVVSDKERTKERGVRQCYMFADEYFDTVKWLEAMQRSLRRVLREERRRARAGASSPGDKGTTRGKESSVLSASAPGICAVGQPRLHAGADGRAGGGQRLWLSSSSAPHRGQTTPTMNSNEEVPVMRREEGSYVAAEERGEGESQVAGESAQEEGEAVDHVQGTVEE